MFLQSISTDMVPTQGTAIGKAITKAVESFGRDEGKNKAIVIITDGENHEDDAVKAAEEAADKGIAIHTIGMGSANGAPIPVYRGNVREGFRKDKDGNMVVTRLNEPALQEIAAAGNGIYVRASNADSGLESVLVEIDKLDKKQISSKIFREYEDRFQWFVAAALLILLVETFLTERKSKLYKKLDLFGDANK
jgi:Ca-activated chloride channel family protein